MQNFHIGNSVCASPVSEVAPRPPYREFPYVEFPQREIPYAPVQFQKWRHFSLQVIFLCRIPYAPVQFWEVAPLPYWKFPYRKFSHREFPYRNFLFFAPLLQKICCVIQFHSACSILPVVPLVVRRGQLLWWQRQSGASGSGKFSVPRCPKPQRQSS